MQKDTLLHWKARMDRTNQEVLHAQISLPDFFRILIPLSLIGLLIYFFHIEMDIRLIGIMPVILLGFSVYAFLPTDYRLPFLFLMNTLAIFRLLGWQDGGVLMGLGLLLFGVANLPVAWRYRAIAVLLAAILLFAFRTEWLPLLGSRTILPILGSMFMFRMLLYLYEMQYEKQSAGFWKKLNYFFLLPNLIFVIFPVVDYNTFVRNYYAQPSFETYRRGILMMGNGVLHFLLYRLIYFYLVPAPEDVQGAFDLLQYMVSSYALIVRLAGIFHFSVGVLCLFGFHLPHAFDHYFFASNFSDLWRRINIYWRDFVTKVFYLPIYFKIKHLGPSLGLFLSVIIVFVLNWFLHGYQWFWIRGSFPLTVQDITFWSVLGVSVAFTSVIQARRRPVRPDPNLFSVRKAWTHSWNVIGIFLFMSVLWSFWVSYSPSDWWAVVQRGQPSSSLELPGVALALVLIALLGIGLQYLRFMYLGNRMPLKPSVSRTFQASTMGMALLLVFALPAVNKPLGAYLNLDMEPILYTKLNKADQMQLYKGYYETLIVSNNLNSRIWELEQAKPDEWRNFNTLGVSERLPDIRLKALKSNVSVPFKGALLTTNSHGLRDREYALDKPENTIRIALLGGSIEMGTGVNTLETYENIAEDYLNDRPELLNGKQVEIFNFAIAGNHLFQNVAIFEQQAAQFDFDAVLYVAHNNEMRRMLSSSIYRTLSTRRDLVYPELIQAVEDAEINQDISEQEFIRLLAPRARELTLLGYQKILDKAREQNCIPIWLYLSSLDESSDEGDQQLMEEVTQLGFHLLDISYWQGKQNAEALKLAPWDAHPNSVGHQLMAKALIEQLEANTSLLNALKSVGE